MASCFQRLSCELTDGATAQLAVGMWLAFVAFVTYKLVIEKELTHRALDKLPGMPRFPIIGYLRGCASWRLAAYSLRSMFAGTCTRWTRTKRPISSLWRARAKAISAPASRRFGWVRSTRWSL